MFRLNRMSDLPNAFGGRDIYGGKVDRGYAEVKLLKISEKALTLEISDINKSSSETTMDRYMPLAQRGISVNTKVENKLTIGGESAERPYTLEFDTSKQPDIVIAGVRITVLNVQPYTIQYRLDDLNQKVSASELPPRRCCLF